MDLDASAVVAIVAAVISLLALAASVHQARSASRQAQSATDQVAEARAQTGLQRQMHRDAAQPYVWVDVRPDDGQGQLMKVVLENGGPTVATDLRVTFTPPLPDGTTSHPGDVFTALDAGVSSLAPGRSMHWTIGVGHRLLQGATARTYEVTVDAIGPFGPTEQLRYTINLSEWKQTLAVPPGTLHEVRRAIVDLNTTLKSR